MADFFEVVLSQRAHRALLTDPIGDDQIERLLEAAIHAPSAENSQPWAFVVVREAALRGRIAELVRGAWEGGARQHSQSRLGERLLADVEGWATGGLAQAPVLIVICGDTSRVDSASLAASIFPATQNLLLAAHALGLGSLLSTLATVRGAELGALLELPPSLRPMAVVPIGRPARALRPPRRVPVRHKAFRDRFGCPW